ncbi:uncharacterized protein [Nicotiana sylvestris]|uniref:uncharacterized protein n=1 Tax=Nicotiana sylvestris TaxID=4096 RepID=UPI00388CCD99
MGPAGKDSRSKHDNPRYDHRSRNRESSSSSRFGNDRNTRESQDDDRNLKARFGGYNFNVSTSELVGVLRSMGDKVWWPKEMRSNPNKRNPDHWCEFHNDHGHKTADCRLLQGEFDHLLKQGYLIELFSERGKQAYMKNRQEPPKSPSPKRTVNVIRGGEDINGVTYTTTNKVSKVTITHGKRVRHVLEEESIMFDDVDADGVLSPHNDVLVISLLVHDTNVKRVLIDPGSSVNIILLRVLHEIQAEDKLIPKAHTLSGFDNSSAGTKGEVILTTFTEGVVKDTKFQVVDMEMAYNIILGRPWIHEMDVVPSTLHQTSDQNVSRTFGKIMEVYIDVMLVKTQHSGDHISHLSDTFKILRKFNMKLNPEKCAFGVASSLKKQDQFEWTEECQQALKNLKIYLSNSSLLAKPKAGERLLIYLVISEVAGASLGIVLVPPMGETIRQAIKCYSITNNEVEYEAVIAGLELARELGINQIVIKNDSQHVVNQMLGTYTAKEAQMQQYLEKVRDLIRQIQTWKVIQKPRDENVEVDALANLASAANVASNENASYGTVPEDKKKAHALWKKAARYCLK